MSRVPRGILFEQRLGTAVHLDHFPPSAALRPYVTRYWLGRWDLRGQPSFEQPIIPHPCVNIEVVRGRSPICERPAIARSANAAWSGSTHLLCSAGGGANRASR